MTTQYELTFTDIRTEGALLPVDILERIRRGDADLGGLRSEDYHLGPGEKLNEAISRSWNRLRSAWINFEELAGRLPEDDPGTTVTRERWLLPLFQELGYGRLLTSKAIDLDGKSYPISHRWGDVPIHLVGWNVPLDRRSAGVAGAARSSPHGMVQEYLNRADESLWAFLSNGRRLRILRDNASLTRQAYIEFDLESMFQGEAYADFALLWLLCHQSRVEAEQPEACWMEAWSRTAKEQGVRALDELRQGVEDAIGALGRGFLRHPANRSLRRTLRSGDLTAKEYYHQLLHLVYRLIFLFAAEDRDLLLNPGASPSSRELYQRYYSTRRLRRLAERRWGTRHSDLYFGQCLVMDRLGEDGGCPELGLPALGSFLWSPEALPHLTGCEIANRDYLDAIRSLAFRREGKVRRAVDYKNLGPEEFGGVYESLLELEPVLNPDAGTFEICIVGGNDRKTTGSYYTPDSLIQVLLDSALDPVIEEAVCKEDPEIALLDLKICDPACGSGHFLIAAAHRVAHRLASLRTGEGEPSPEALRSALREVVSRCIYGVDVNPLTVELCKVNLWLEALEPGRPLSFLDHHIVRGNSLLGATPAMTHGGIPDEAFEPLEGDEKAYASSLKKQNKQEREGQLSLFHEFMINSYASLRRIAARSAEIRWLDTDSVQARHEMERRYVVLTCSEEYRREKLKADAWCAAFLWRKRVDSPPPVTSDILLRLTDNCRSVSPVTLDEVRNIAEQYQFLHWHLAFPDVFLSEEEEFPLNEAEGWNGGFDVVLGNPPWEHTELKEKEWFAKRHPEIASASTGARRKRLIKDLRSENPFLYHAYIESKRQHDAVSHIARGSGRYPLCGRGRINTYAIFAELNRSLINLVGRVGCIVPTGIATDDTTKYFFQDLMDQRSLVSLYDFENKKKLFPAVDSRVKFCLLTLTGLGRPAVDGAEFVFFAYDVADLRDDERRFSLTSEDIALLNPNTRTCPIFRSRRDAELTKAIYRRVPVLIEKGPPIENHWGITFKQGLFNMTGDSHLFRTREQLEAEGWALEGNIFIRGAERYLPLYEGRLGHQFDHRFAVQPSARLREVTKKEHEDPQFLVEPQYWISQTDTSERLARRETLCCTGLLGHRRVARNTDERTSIATIIPWGAASYGWILSQGPSAVDLLTLAAMYNSLPFDYLLRNSLSQPSIPQSTFAQLACIPRHSFSEEQIHMITKNVLELSYTAWDLELFALDCGYDGPPFHWDEERRFFLRCELDAIFFHLYGIDRNDVDYIMETFPIVRRKDEAQYGEYRTKRVILETYDEMQRAIETGEPYQTRLDSPPADPRVTHGAEPLRH